MKYLVNICLHGTVEVESNSTDEVKAVVNTADYFMEFGHKYSGRVFNRVFVNRTDVLSIDNLGGKIQKYVLSKEQYMYYYLHRDGTIKAQLSNMINHSRGPKKYFTSDFCRFYKPVKCINDLIDFIVESERLGAKPEEITRIKEDNKINQSDIESYLRNKNNQGV